MKQCKHNLRNDSCPYCELELLRARIEHLEKEIKEKDAMILRMEIALRMDKGKE